MAPNTTIDDDRTVVCSRAEILQLKRTYASLVILQGNDMGKHFTIRRKDLVIGRTSMADIMVKDKRISRSHAKIEVVFLPDKGNRYRLVDLDSTNHVYVNGKQICEHLLENGDKIQVGDSILKFELQDLVDTKFHADIQRKIEYDALTALLTYESFKAALGWELANAGKKRSLSLLMMDLDDFKKVNDTYGHLTGSFILQEIGRIIRESIRQFDVAARYGGEEFTVYLPDTNRRKSHRLAERLRKMIAESTFEYDNNKVNITISIGISGFPQNGTSIEELVGTADSMLYKAKRDGKNRVYTAK